MSVNRPLPVRFANDLPVRDFTRSRLVDVRFFAITSQGATHAQCVMALSLLPHYADGDSVAVAVGVVICRWVVHKGRPPHTCHRKARGGGLLGNACLGHCELAARFVLQEAVRGLDAAPLSVTLSVTVRGAAGRVRAARCHTRTAVICDQIEKLRAENGGGGSGFVGVAHRTSASPLDDSQGCQHVRHR